MVPRDHLAFGWAYSIVAVIVSNTTFKVWCDCWMTTNVLRRSVSPLRQVGSIQSPSKSIKSRSSLFKSIDPDTIQGDGRNSHGTKEFGLRRRWNPWDQSSVCLFRLRQPYRSRYGLLDGRRYPRAVAKWFWRSRQLVAHLTLEINLTFTCTSITANR